jgi:putative DNA methylase
MSDYPIKSPRKLIEVALPLDAINAACSREKSIRHGHPSTLHLWWARRPMAAARAVIFAQMVNDPGYERHLGRGVNKENAAVERERLFKIIEKLVLWKNNNNEAVLAEAQNEIWKSWRETCALNKTHPQAADLFNPDRLPAFHDPFAGGGTLPLEAQRLGLESYASDLNPVAVLITKATIEIPRRFTGVSPVGPHVPSDKQVKLHSDWSGAKGLAEDVRRYGHLVRVEAEKRIGHLFPKIEVSQDSVADRPDLTHLVGQTLTVKAWIWARTVKSPNPAFSHVDVPIVSTFILSSKAEKNVWIEPVVEGDSYRFRVRLGTPPENLKLGTRSGKAQAFICLVSNTAIARPYIQQEGKSGRLGTRLMAVVAEGPDGRVFIAPDEVMASIAKSLSSDPIVEDTRKGVLSGATPTRAMITGGVCSAYGMKTWGDLFTPRQIIALATFSDLVSEIRPKIIDDFYRTHSGGDDEGRAQAYADAISTYLAFGVSRAADFWSSNATWESSGGFVSHVFTKQALPMVWDYAESNPFSAGTGNWEKTCIDWIARVVREFSPKAGGFSVQAAAQDQKISINKVVSTDPPYYNNISYAVLADYFYVWLRRTLKPIFPDLFSTVSTPKSEELVATVSRHEGKDAADTFFLGGMTSAMTQLACACHPSFPVTIYYAYKQSETKDDGTSSTGWEGFLDAVIRAGFAITGTWPMRTERANRSVGINKNALASSIVLVCRKHTGNAATISRREFLRELNAVLPEALDEMTKGAGGEHSPVAPVDLSQAIIGPGMGVFSKYAAVLEADGSPMSVRTALQLINRFLAEDDFDADTQFCLHWFEQHGWAEGVFGEADVLARSKSTSVDAIKEAGVLHSGIGKVRLLKWAEYPTDWDPRTDTRTPVWEALHQLIRALKQGGDSASGALLAGLGGKAEAIRQLAYRLYTLCDRLGQAEDARAYNDLITSWTGIESAAASAPTSSDPQGKLFES